jgi:hypothetical protein
MARQLSPIRYPAESTTTAFPSKATASGRQLCFPPEATFAGAPVIGSSWATSIHPQPDRDSNQRYGSNTIPDGRENDPANKQEPARR